VDLIAVAIYVTLFTAVLVIYLMWKDWRDNGRRPFDSLLIDLDEYTADLERRRQLWQPLSPPEAPPSISHLTPDEQDAVRLNQLLAWEIYRAATSHRADKL